LIVTTALADVAPILTAVAPPLPILIVPVIVENKLPVAAAFPASNDTVPAAPEPILTVFVPVVIAPPNVYVLPEVELVPIEPVIAPVAALAIVNVVAAPNKLPTVVILLNTLAVVTPEDATTVAPPVDAPETVNVLFPPLPIVTLAAELPIKMVVDAKPICIALVGDANNEAVPAVDVASNDAVPTPTLIEILFVVPTLAALPKVNVPVAPDEIVTAVATPNKLPAVATVLNTLAVTTPVVVLIVAVPAAPFVPAIVNVEFAD